MPQKNNAKIASPKKETKKHPISIKDAIVEVLRKRPILKKTELVKYVKKRSNYETAAIDTEISELKDKVIVAMKSIKLQKYGIDEPDGKAVWFILKETLDINGHIDNVLDLLKSKTESDIKSAISELDMYGSRYVLDRNQLSFMVDSLSSNSAEMDYGLMKIIFTHAYSYGIYPYKKSDFLKKIESLVKNTKMKSDKNLRVILIWALGLYEKPSVVENLKADLIDFNQELMGLNQEKRVEKLVEKRRDYESAYMQPVTSKVIEANRSELFDFQRQLEKSGKKEASLLLSQIRRKAAEDVRLKRFDEPIKMPDSVQSVIYSNVIL